MKKRAARHRIVTDETVKIVSVSTQLPREIYNEFTRVTHEKGQSRSEVVRELILGYLRNKGGR